MSHVLDLNELKSSDYAVKNESVKARETKEERKHRARLIEFN
jgi:hypothetical protein